MEEEQLIPKNKNKVNDILKIFIVFSISTTYLVYLILIYNDIHSIFYNLKTVSNIFNQYNEGEFAQIRENLNEINDCIIHKYCKRIPN